MDLSKYIVTPEDTILGSMQKIDRNKKGFVIVSEQMKLRGTLTDGDIRRALLQGFNLKDKIKDMVNKASIFLYDFDSFDVVVEKFKSEKITFLPIVNSDMTIVNIITKEQLHETLLEGWELDLKTDFSNYDFQISHEIYNRPWGFYKTVFLSKYAQAKVIHVNPLQRLSLQYHKKREEHWVVVKGFGEITIGDSIREIHEGAYMFIPKGCLHRVQNTSKNESLIISEVQLGSYFGEDDIIRIEDDYDRK